MNYYETIVLCQPDGRKSCSACCGLFNFKDISRENLTRFLMGGATRSSSHIATGDITDQGDGMDVRDLTSYICPHQGLIFNKRPGCLLHPQYRTSTMRNNSFFGENICDGFLCPAHTIMTTEQKKILIDLIDDWYSYSIAVIDPDTTVWLIQLLLDRYPISFQREEVAKKILFESLQIHARYLTDYSGPVFFYSVSEYTIGKKHFSISSSDEREKEKVEITALIEHNL